MPDYRGELSDYDKELFSIIECAFGSELDKDTYMFLLWYLYEHTENSQRGVAITVGRYLNKYYLEIYHDVLVSLNDYQHSEQTAKLEAKLKSCGFDDWLKEWLKALNPPANDEAD